MSRVIVLVVLAASMFCTTPAHAADAGSSGLRLGLGVGVANIDFDRGFSGDDTALSAFAAYRFNRYLSAELSYMDGGSPQDNGVNVDVTSATAMVVGAWPLVGDVWSVIARAGVVSWSWEAVDVKREGTDVAYGVGTAVDLKRWQVRLIGDMSETDDARLVHLSLQAAWKF